MGGDESTGKHGEQSTAEEDVQDELCGRSGGGGGWQRERTVRENSHGGRELEKTRVLFQLSPW